ncbi:hypothetical protein SISSUDRAFT_1055241 [Sistotremastrum suecicum HHB10207 ss-3]|uniref:Uncharacterized protein n=1 Tax=Sistotremastrum suecicum HHB10207 ss-3 TaxID=1314776 RepID=A0A165XXS9_9AGAM|nr:hypothetical protein SISSUDRAFT_1055241 [Sistotremastrum suecicum HHB10207 ss-3]
MLWLRKSQNASQRVSPLKSFFKSVSKKADKFKAAMSSSKKYEVAIPSTEAIDAPHTTPAEEQEQAPSSPISEASVTIEIAPASPVVDSPPSPTGSYSSDHLSAPPRRRSYFDFDDEPEEVEQVQVLVCEPDVPVVSVTTVPASPFVDCRAPIPMPPSPTLLAPPPEPAPIETAPIEFVPPPIDIATATPAPAPAPVQPTMEQPAVPPPVVSIFGPSAFDNPPSLTLPSPSPSPSVQPKLEIGSAHDRLRASLKAASQTIDDVQNNFMGDLEFHEFIAKIDRTLEDGKGKGKAVETPARQSKKGKEGTKPSYGGIGQGDVNKAGGMFDFATPVGQGEVFTFGAEVDSELVSDSDSDSDEAEDEEAVTIAEILRGQAERLIPWPVTRRFEPVIHPKDGVAYLPCDCGDCGPNCQRWTGHDDVDLQERQSELYEIYGAARSFDTLSSLGEVRPLCLSPHRLEALSDVVSPMRSLYMNAPERQSPVDIVIGVPGKWHCEIYDVDQDGNAINVDQSKDNFDELLRTSDLPWEDWCRTYHRKDKHPTEWLPPVHPDAHSVGSSKLGGARKGRIDRERQVEADPSALPSTSDIPWPEPYAPSSMVASGSGVNLALSPPPGLGPFAPSSSVDSEVPWPALNSSEPASPKVTEPPPILATRRRRARSALYSQYPDESDDSFVPPSYKPVSAIAPSQYTSPLPPLSSGSGSGIIPPMPSLASVAPAAPAPTKSGSLSGPYTVNGASFWPSPKTLPKNEEQITTQLPFQLIPKAPEPVRVAKAWSMKPGEEPRDIIIIGHIPTLEELKNGVVEQPTVDPEEVDESMTLAGADVLNTLSTVPPLSSPVLSSRELGLEVPEDIAAKDLSEMPVITLTQSVSSESGSRPVSIIEAAAVLRDLKTEKPTKRRFLPTALTSRLPIKFPTVRLRSLARPRGTSEPPSSDVRYHDIVEVNPDGSRSLTGKGWAALAMRVGQGFGSLRGSRIGRSFDEFGSWRTASTVDRASSTVASTLEA